MLKEQIFDTGVVRLNYVEGPESGPPLVLLHGGGDHWQDFLPVMPMLTTQWHIFAVDLRGHGKSGRVPGQYRPEDYVADIIAFLEALFTKPVILFGHSLGGWIALMVASQLKEKITALILGDPPLNLDSFVAMENSDARIGMWRMIRDLVASGVSVSELAKKLGNLPVSDSTPDGPSRYADLPSVDAVSIRAWAKTLSQVDPDAAMYHAEGRIIEYIENVNIERDLGKITCPMLLLQGDPAQGGLVTDEDAENALVLAADGICVRLDGVGHDLGLGSWTVRPLLRALINFLETI